MNRRDGLFVLAKKETQHGERAHPGIIVPGKEIQFVKRHGGSQDFVERLPSFCHLLVGAARSRRPIVKNVAIGYERQLLREPAKVLLGGLRASRRKLQDKRQKST